MAASYRRSPAAPPDADGGVTVHLHPSTVAVVFERGPGRVLVQVHGEIDMEDASALRGDLVPALRAARTGLDVDLSQVTFCDSSGLDVLLYVNRLAAETGKSLVLTALSRPVARLLDLTGTLEVFAVRDGPVSAA
ncbi:STAS domain-containing protein [Streptomyces sp. NBC_00249]|uniref:STAS domain-containing protein n=1 Tax=Streptomyces sp. NBC_00249 TaxID=2975690 RepID=UPI0022500A6B|nr:STAS domain-containing protein [Streptomyces sp. NBC_00249]MCX5195420.1 STAS domain-containing protein [Streptomyces sp. NBC_00249]